MKIFEPKLFTTLKGYRKKQLIDDLIAGLIVAIIALPLSIALAIASGVGPEKGLYTAIVAGFVIALFGGSRVNISGPTAAFATIVAGIVATEGLDGLVIATILAGILLVLFGICRLGSLIKYIPFTITTGFTAGIAVTIIIGQLKDFFGLTPAPGTNAVETIEKIEMLAESFSTFNWQSFLVGALSLAILIVWPRISKKIPGSLVVVLLGSLAVNLLGMKVNTIGDLYQISSALPTPAFPAFTLDRVLHLLPNALTIALLAAIESLLSCVVSDGMIDDRHNSNTELIAQGLGNICSGLFGGIPATGAIARTAANVKNGGRSPIAGMVHAVVLLLILVVLMPFAAWIPMPVIAAILLMVAYNMSEWRRFVRICKTASAADILVLVVTFVLTVVFDLVVAIAAGLILAAFLFLKKSADLAEVREWKADRRDGKQVPYGTVVYEIHGPMFFAASDKFLQFPIHEDTRVMIVRMSDVSMLDSTAEQNVERVCEVCKRNGVKLLLAHVNPQPMETLRRCGIVERLGEDAFCAHIDDAIARAERILKAGENAADANAQKAESETETEGRCLK
ncbi:MAG: STAS domain-containing protein [Ruminococcaceae bacterium]|nr:STAS domain-containing protein [Oscillospiraceae bacterium]